MLSNRAASARLPPAFTKRRQPNVKHVQTEVEVLAKGAVLDLFRQILVSSRDDPDIDPVRGLAAYRRNDFVLQHAENFCLHLPKHVADLIEK
ncbi:MAG: hypothetical protein WB586_21120 [Chthoniobacterales bacterium]